VLLSKETDVGGMRTKMVQTFRLHNPSFRLKRVPRLRTRQALVLVSLSLVNFASFCAISIMAPFFTKEAEAKGVPVTVAGFIFGVYAFVVFLGTYGNGKTHTFTQSNPGMGSDTTINIV
jgi:hypothetical protein